MKKRIYVAGPVTGAMDMNWRSHQAVAVALRAKGYHVESPAALHADQKTKSVESKRISFARLLTCEAICMLPGWEESCDARMAHAIAASLDMEVVPVLLTIECVQSGGMALKA